MAFVTATPQPVQRWFSSHINPSELPKDFSTSFNPEILSSSTVHDNIPQFYMPVKRKDHIITQSATQLNCYDTPKLPRVTLHPIPDTYYTPTLSRTCSQRVNVPTETVQHRSMIELDERRDGYGSSADHAHMFNCEPTFRWLQNASASISAPTQSPGRNPTAGFMRFTIQDLIQQECCVGAVNYVVDQPSKLVRIECRKPGCRCVLKNESALALKIVNGVTLVQGRWLMPVKPGTKLSLAPGVQNSVYSYGRATYYYSAIAEQKSDVSPVILTTCCPSWFELISRRGSTPCPEVPVWSSAKALWRAKPRFFLLRKPIQCMVGSVSQPLTMSVADVFKPEQNGVSLDASNVITLRAGTVLELLDCRACRLVHHDPATSSHLGVATNIGSGLLSRHRSKTVPMLQCAIVGARALATVASVAKDLSVKDGLRWLADGPRLVYLSLDSKCISCSPVVGGPVIQPDSRQATLLPSKTHSNSSSTVGVHSLLSLLTRSELPGLVRPLTGLRPNEWFPPGKVDRRFASNAAVDDISSLTQTPLLQLEQCFHGDLIFLEPLSDCAGATEYSDSQPRAGTSRFFVVTTDMLAQHNFFLAEATSSMQYTQALEAHACRVAHFLAASHPAQGLAYLTKHLEDISLSLDTGPSHMPLTRTLGPVSRSVNYGTIQAALTSVAAAATLTTDDPEDFYANQPLASDRESQSDLNGTLTVPLGASSLSSIDRYQSSGCLIGSKTRTHSSLSSSLLASEVDQMNALCDEIEDIYFYVRNGRFPAQSRSMTSLVHHVATVGRNHRPVPQTSAPISPQADELFPDGSLRPRLQQHRREFASKARHASIDVHGPSGKVAPQPVSGLIKRPQKSPFLYIPRTLAQSQHIPVYTTRQSPVRDMDNPHSPKNYLNVLPSGQTSMGNLTDNPSKNKNMVRVFQSPGHDSGVDITVHQSFDGQDRLPNQSMYPCKLYTNTRVLTMSKTSAQPPNRYTAAMTQSQTDGSQSAVPDDCKHRSRDENLSAESVSAFRLQTPRGNFGDHVSVTPSDPIGQFSRSNMTESRHPVSFAATSSPNDPVPNRYPSLTCMPEESRLAKSPLRVIDLRNMDSPPSVAQRSTRMLSFNTIGGGCPVQPLSHASSTTTTTVNPNAIYTRPHCSCQTTNHHRVPSNQRSTEPLPPYRPESVWCDRRTGQPLGRFPPQPVMLLSSAPSEELLNLATTPAGPYATPASRQSKHRTELTNSSPDTGIGGESGVEIPCTVLPVPCGMNVRGTPVRLDAPDRGSARNGFAYGPNPVGTTRSKQLYQI